MKFLKSNFVFRHFRIVMTTAFILLLFLLAYYFFFFLKVSFRNNPVNKKFYLTKKEIKHLEEQKEADASYKLSLYYDKIEHDNIKALKWLEKAANLNHYTAQYNLAIYYENTENFERALYWYTRSAEFGNDISSQYKLGEFYKSGFNGKVDIVKAAFWYKKAALNGEPLAIVDLSELLTQSELYANNKKEAYAWNLIVEDITNSPSYKLKVEKIKKSLLEQMSSDEIHAATELSTNLKNKIGCVKVLHKGVSKICWDNYGNRISKKIMERK